MPAASRRELKLSDLLTPLVTSEVMAPPPSFTLFFPVTCAGAMLHLEAAHCRRRAVDAPAAFMSYPNLGTWRREEAWGEEPDTELRPFLRQDTLCRSGRGLSPE